jgi:hypothetical protein
MKSFLAGKKALETAPLQSPAKSSTHSRAHGPQGHVHPGPSGPQVEAVKQGDKVTRLIVTCSCGEKIEIDCLYPVGS